MFLYLKYKDYKNVFFYELSIQTFNTKRCTVKDIVNYTEVWSDVFNYQYFFRHMDVMVKYLVQRYRFFEIETTH